MFNHRLDTIENRLDLDRHPFGCGRNLIVRRVALITTLKLPETGMKASTTQCQTRLRMALRGH